MPFIIDGDNLLGTWPGRRRSDADKRELAMQVARLSAAERKRFITVFDGTAPPGVSFGAGVRFAGPGRTADELILDILREQEHRRGCVVVTSDRSLGDQCRYLEARVERCDRFRGRLRAGHPTEKPEHEDEIEFWLRQFGE